MNFERARKIADAVLYEGYILYPYRASSRKNQLRWQFGVLAPRAWSEAGGCEEWWRQTQCLVECGDVATRYGQGPVSASRRAADRNCRAGRRISRRALH